MDVHYGNAMSKVNFQRFDIVAMSNRLISDSVLQMFVQINNFRKISCADNCLQAGKSLYRSWHLINYWLQIEIRFPFFALQIYKGQSTVSSKR